MSSVSSDVTSSYEITNVTFANTSDLYNHGNTNTNTHIPITDYGLCGIYCLVAALIVFGNSLVIASIVRFTYLRTITNIYILFLACSDITVSLSLVYGGAFILNQVSWHKYWLPCLLRYSLMIYSLMVSMALHVGKLTKSLSF